MEPWGKGGGGSGQEVHFRFWVLGGELCHLGGSPGGGGELVFVILQCE